MTTFEIDVSGSDILDTNYTVCVANGSDLIRGFKMTKHLVRTLNSRYGQEFYRYPKSQKGKATFKVRLYCTIIYRIFEALQPSGSISLKICRDFNGKEQDIKDQLMYLLEKLLGMNIKEVNFVRLPHGSVADQYAYLMRKDTKNLMKNYILIDMKQFEEFLK